jgi:hypothetical protein
VAGVFKPFPQSDIGLNVSPATKGNNGDAHRFWLPTR